MESNTKRSSQTLFKALKQVTEQLGINDDETMSILQINTLDELHALIDKRSIDPDSQSGQAALQLINVGVSLWQLNSGDETLMRHFLRTKNKQTQGKPIDQMKNLDGLSAVNVFLYNLV